MIDLPIGVSQWKEHGVTFGYWEYFTDEIRKEMKAGLIAALEGVKEKSNNVLFSKFGNAKYCITCEREENECGCHDWNAGRAAVLAAAKEYLGKKTNESS